jgi:hypothetical protein
MPTPPGRILAEVWQEVSMSARRFFPGLVILCLAPLGFASGLPKHVELEVRLDQMLSSEISHSGDRFSATLDRDVTLGDKTVLKKGASVQGVVREAESTLNSSEPGELELVLSSVASEGNNYAVATNPLRISGDPSGGAANGRDAVEQGAIGVIVPRPSQNIPGMNVAVGRPVAGRQVILPARSK